MLHKKINTWIHKDIDDLLSRKARKKLLALLKKDEDTKKVYQQLHETKSLLNHLTDIEPPPDLQKRVMNTLDARSFPLNRKRKKSMAFVTEHLPWLKPKWIFALGLGICMGIFLQMIVFMESPKKTEIDSQDVLGTIGLNEVGKTQIEHRLPIDLPEIRGEIIFKESEGFLRSEVNLKATDDFEMNMKFDSAKIHFKGYVSLNQKDFLLKRDSGDFSTFNSKDARYILVFQKMEPQLLSIDLSLMLNGYILYQQKVLVKQ